jgi:hypothetical protein
MICPFEIDIDRIAQALVVPANTWSPVRGRWDTDESHVLSRVPPAKANPGESRNARPGASDRVWRNLDLRFSTEEPAGSGKAS